MSELIATLPAWVRWGPAVFYPCLALGTLLPLTWLLEGWLLRALRALPRGAHWSERARVGFPARTRLVSWAMAATLLVAMAWVLWLGRLTPIGIAIAPVLAILVGTSLTVLRVARIVAPDRPRLSIRGLVGMLALGWGSLPILGAGLLLAGDAFDARTLLVVCATAGLVLLWSAGAPAAVALRLGLFEVAPERVVERVAASAARLGIAPPRTLVAELPMANAFALVLARRLVFTRALLAHLDDEALSAVVEHEMTHFTEPPSATRARLVSSLALLPLVLARPVHGVFGAPGTLALACGAILLIALTAAVRRLLERPARKTAATGEESAAYARVLERIYEINGIPAVMRGAWASGTSLHDRMRAAGVEPSFERPAPPPRLLVPLLTCFVLAIAALMGTRVLLMWAEVVHGERLAVIHVVVATTGGDGQAFEQLGYARYLSGDVEGAVTAYAAAAELEPDDAEPRALVARLRMMEGDCRAAAASAWEASVVADRAGDARDRQLVRSIRRELENCENR